MKRLPEGDEMVALKERIVRILKRLKVGQDLLDNLYTDGFVGLNGDKLAKSIQAVLHVVRGLIMNPEFLVIHKPTALLGEEQAILVLEMLREHVQQVSLR